MQPIHERSHLPHSQPSSAALSATPRARHCPDAKASAYQTFSVHTSKRTSSLRFQTVLRNLLQEARINSMAAQNALAVCGSSAERLAQKSSRPRPPPQSLARHTFANGQTPTSLPLGMWAPSTSRRVRRTIRPSPSSPARPPLTRPRPTPWSTSTWAGPVYTNIDGTADSLQFHTKEPQEKSSPLRRTPSFTRTSSRSPLELSPRQAPRLRSIDGPRRWKSPSNPSRNRLREPANTRLRVPSWRARRGR